MRIKDIKIKNITITNIFAFIEGTSKYYYSLLKEEPLYIQEQRLLRFHICKDCMESGECKKCFCEVPERMFTDSNCKKKLCCEWPSLMDEQQWTIYKKISNINVENFK